MIEQRGIECNTYCPIIMSSRILRLLSRNKELALASVLALYTLCSLLYSLSIVWGFTTDDAYISWFYARHLAEGKGLLWHSEMPPVEGYSNFLWIILAALVMKLQLPLLTTMKAISSICLFMGLVCLYRLARLFFTPLLAILPVMLYSHYIGVVWWTVSGLETACFASLCIAFSWLVMKSMGYAPIDFANKETSAKGSSISWFFANLSLLFLSLTRFEGIVWVMPMLCFLLCHLHRDDENSLFRNKSRLFKWIGISSFVFIIPYGLYFAWRLYYFGHWIPNSYSCKAMAEGQWFIVDFDYVQILLPLIVASLPYFVGKKDCRHILLWLPSLIYALMLFKADPVIAHFIRLFLGPFALFTVLPVLGVQQFLSYFNQPKCDPKIGTVLVISVMMLLFIPGNNIGFLQRSVIHYQQRTANRDAVAELLNKEAKQGATVLLDDCGVIPFKTRDDIRFIDAQCLNNSELSQAPYNRHLELYAQHLNAVVKPDWVVVNYYPLEQRGDHLNDILSEMHFYEHYHLVKTLESGFIEGNNKVTDYLYRVYKRK